MVDLGFILITFFIYTTTLAKPNVLDVTTPSKEPTPTPTVYPDESTVTVIPVKDHRVYYYFGALQTREQFMDTSMAGIRWVLKSKKREAASLPVTFSAEAHKLHVVIKPNNDCKYADVVQLLDEMEIVAVPVFAIADISQVEKEWIEK